MSEYLNRDDVLNCFHAWIDKHGDAHEPDEMEEYRNIEALPSIELVRCKDCKFYVPEEDGRCDVIEQFDLPEMFFCAYGERGEADDET